MDKRSLLENLDAEKREWILETATHMARLSDMLIPLKENGIDVSLSTLQRFVRRHREGMLLSEGEDMKETVEALAKRGRGELFRKGTLEAVRQRLYDQAMTSNSREETQALFAELLKEEAKLKELELEERKQLLAEEQARLQRLRLRIELRRELNRGKGKQKAMIEVESEIADCGLPNADCDREKTGTDSGDKLLTEGHEGNEEKKGRAALERLDQLREILNRGGGLEEKILEARAVLANERSG